jgi:hypothetical protein
MLRLASSISNSAVTPSEPGDGPRALRDFGVITGDYEVPRGRIELPTPQFSFVSDLSTYVRTCPYLAYLRQAASADIRPRIVRSAQVGIIVGIGRAGADGCLPSVVVGSWSPPICKLFVGHEIRGRRRRNRAARIRAAVIGLPVGQPFPRCSAFRIGAEVVLPSLRCALTSKIWASTVATHGQSVPTGNYRGRLLPESR